MSWQMLDGQSRRPRLNWAVPEHLRDNSRYGPFRRLSVPAPLNPDALLQYIDNAISITENAQATRQLSRLFASSSSSSPSVSSSTSLLTSSSPLPSSSSSSSLSSSSLVGNLGDGGPSMPSPVPSARKMSRFKSVPIQQTAYIKSLLKRNDNEEATSAPKLNFCAVSETKNDQPPDEQGSTKTGLPDESKSQQDGGVSEDNAIADKKEEYDAQAADAAYRAACCAISEGDAELALSHLNVAATKCPPAKQNALGKVHRLMAAVMQLMEKNSAVLRSLAVDKDMQ